MKVFFLILSVVVSVFAESKIFFGSHEYNIAADSSLKKEMKKIDDSLYARWTKGMFIYPDSIGELLDICGCACDNGPGPCCYDDVITISSSHNIGDSLWLFDHCGERDSIVDISDNLDYGPAYTVVKEKSELWVMIKDFKKKARNLKVKIDKMRAIPNQ